MDEIQKADPAARRRMFSLLLVAIVVGGVTLFLLSRRVEALQALARTSPAEARAGAVRMLYGVTAMMAVASGAAGVETLRIGLKTARAQRFPPPGMRVVRDTPVRVGKLARGMGIAGIALGALLLGAAGALPLWVYVVVQALRAGR